MKLDVNLHISAVHVWFEQNIVKTPTSPKVVKMYKKQNK